MRIINSLKFAKTFNELYDHFDDDTVKTLDTYNQNDIDTIDYKSLEQGEIPVTDDNVDSFLVDNLVNEYGEEEEKETGVLEEDPLIKEFPTEAIPVKEVPTEEEFIEQEVPAAEESQPDVVSDAKEYFGSDILNAMKWAIEEQRVVQIFYNTEGKNRSTGQRRYLKREKGLPKLNSGGVSINRIIEPHYIFYARTTKRNVLVTYDRSVRCVRAFIVDNITDYNFTKKRGTEEDQYFSFRNSKIQLPGNKIEPIKGINNMKNINENLIEVGAALKSKGLVKSAAIVKNAEDTLNNLKTAQYVGAQGYWIRNRRCWDNCYRQKRTTQPESSAQEVWMECWDEYKKSINNNESGWEKYAEKDKNIKIGKKEEKEWNKLFITKVSEKIENGYTTPEAIYASIEEESNTQSNNIIESASHLMELADTLQSSNMKDIGEKLASISAEMLRDPSFFRLRDVEKEAGLWQGVKNIGQGIKDVWNRGQKPEARQQSNEINDWLESLRDQCNTEIKVLQNAMRSQVSKTPSMASSKKSIIIEAGTKMKIVEAAGDESPLYTTQMDTTQVNPPQVNPSQVNPSQVNSPQVNSTTVSRAQANRYMTIFEQANDALSVFGTFSSKNIPQVQKILQPAINNISSIIAKHNQMANTGQFEISQMLYNLQALSSATIQAQRGIDAAEKFTGADLSGDGVIGGESAGAVPQTGVPQTGTAGVGNTGGQAPLTQQGKTIQKPNLIDLNKINEWSIDTLQDIKSKIDKRWKEVEKEQPPKSQMETVSYNHNLKLIK